MSPDVPSSDANHFSGDRLGVGLRWALHGEEVIPAWLAEHEHAPSERLAREVEEILRSTWSGYRLLAELESGAIQAFHTQRVEACAPASNSCPTLVVPGVSSGISLAIRALTSENAPVALASPNYMPLATSITMNGRRVVDWPMLSTSEGWSYDLEQLEGLLQHNEPIEALVVSDPNNPTGHSLSDDEMLTLVRLATEHGVILLVDEAMIDLKLSPRSIFGTLGTSQSVIAACSAVKAHSLGDTRIAFLQFSNVSDLERVGEEISRIHWRPDALGLALTLVALQSGGADLKRVRSSLAADWSLLREALPEVATELLPTDGLTGLLQLDHLGLGDDSIEGVAIREARVALRGPHRFFGGVSGSARVCVGLAEPHRTMMAAQLGEWLGS